jgi:molybdopterin-guanine dinucleotide biosynthesis protein A
MGQDKALLSIDGEAMALRVASALREAGAAEVFGIGGDAEALGRLGLRVIADDHPGEGPFPATLTALRHAPSEVVAVLSCDLLRPSPVSVTALVRALMEGEALGAVPVVDGHHQWTHAVWRRAALEQLQASYEAGVRSLRRAASDLALCEVVDIDGPSVADADTPSDLGPVSPG